MVTRYDDPFPNGCAPTDCSLREATLDANESAGADRILRFAGKYDLTRFTGDDEGRLGNLDLHDDVEIFGADVTIERCDVTNNSFQGNGFGVHSTGGGVLVIRDSAIIHNGNGVLAIGGTASENVTLHSNNSFQIFVGDGALLYCTHCTLLDSVGGNTEVRVSNAIAFFANSIVSGVCDEIAGGVVATQGDAESWSAAELDPICIRGARESYGLPRRPLALESLTRAARLAIRQSAGGREV